jgi:hypothetical protein
MIGVYNTLMLGLALSGVVAYLVANTALGTLFYSAPRQLTALGWIALFAPLGLILVASLGVNRLSPAAIQGLYWGITALQGVGLAALLQAYTGESITHVFFITAAAFGSLSLWGYTTRAASRDGVRSCWSGLSVSCLRAREPLSPELSASAHDHAHRAARLCGVDRLGHPALKDEYVAGMMQGDACSRARSLEPWGCT